MSKFFKDGLLVFLMLLVFIGVFMKSDDDNKQDISSSIENFDDLVNGGEVVDDGFLEDDYENYEGNNIAKGFKVIGDGVVNIINKGIDLFISLVKGVIN